MPCGVKGACLDHVSRDSVLSGKGGGGRLRTLRCGTPASAEPLGTDSRRAAPPVTFVAVGPGGRSSVRPSPRDSWAGSGGCSGPCRPRQWRGGGRARGAVVRWSARPCRPCRARRTALRNSAVVIAAVTTATAKPTSRVPAQPPTAV